MLQISNGQAIFYWVDLIYVTFKFGMALCLSNTINNVFTR